MRRQEYDDEEPYVVVEKRSSGAGAFFIGLALGTVAALLLAPKSGAETRQDLRRRARRARRAAQDLADGLGEKVSGGLEQAKEKVGRRLDGAKQALELKKTQMTRAVEAGRAAAQAARDDLERRIAETKSTPRTTIEVVRPGQAPAMGGDDTPES
jgi:gas vesicle protein